MDWNPQKHWNTGEEVEMWVRDMSPVCQWIQRLVFPLTTDIWGINFILFEAIRTRDPMVSASVIYSTKFLCSCKKNTVLNCGRAERGNEVKQWLIGIKFNGRRILFVCSGFHFFKSGLYCFHLNLAAIKFLIMQAVFLSEEVNFGRKKSLPWVCVLSMFC